MLERCLRALLMQTLDPAEFEIIIVDDDPAGSATRQVVESWQARLASPDLLPMDVPAHPIIAGGAQLASPRTWQVGEQHTARIAFPALYYLPAYHTQGPAAARNLGWHAAAGTLIAFTDDDCQPAPGWLAAGLAAFTGAVAGVSGRVIVPIPARPTDQQRNTTGLERSLFVTANCFYRKAALQAVGGFDEAFPAAWREDSDLFFTLFEAGYTLGQEPAAVVYHPVRPEPWGASLHQQRKSVYNALLYKKHPALYRQYIQSGPPWHYYAMLLALVAVLGGLLAGAPAVTISAGLLWLALYLDFCLRRLRGASLTASHILEMLVTSAIIPYLSIYWRIRGAIRYRVTFL